MNKETIPKDKDETIELSKIPNGVYQYPTYPTLSNISQNSDSGDQENNSDNDNQENNSDSNDQENSISELKKS